jgi:hypothetical protein
MKRILRVYVRFLEEKKVHWKMSLVISEIKNSNSPALFEFQTDGGKKGINGDDHEYI